MHVEIEDQSGNEGGPTPTRNEVSLWVGAALQAVQRDDAQVAVRFVTQAEMQQLNAQFRHQDKPTNVLSFPAAVEEFAAVLAEEELREMGDLVICAAVVADEAHAQGKSLNDHYAHMVVHGTLHLAGLDHEEEQEAQLMEALETSVLAAVGVNDPYQRNEVSGGLDAGVS